MRIRTMLSVFLLAAAACSGPPATGGGDVFERLADFEYMPGVRDLYWDEEGGRLFIDIGRSGEQFLYQASLARGVGSNDLGLDRGQLA